MDSTPAFTDQAPPEQNLSAIPIIPFANVFRRAIKERNSMRKCLALALQTIGELENRITDFNGVVSDTQAILSKHLREVSGSKNFDPCEEMDTKPRWIFDTWVRHPANERLLGVVEYKWIRGEVQYALIELHSVHRRATTFEDGIKCELIKAAILCSCDLPKRALKFTDDVLKECENRQDRDIIVARELCGIAYFVRGKAFMEQKNWNEAYSAFSNALFVPYYQERANELKAEACKKLAVNIPGSSLQQPGNNTLGDQNASTTSVDSEDISWF